VPSTCGGEGFLGFKFQGLPPAQQGLEPLLRGFDDIFRWSAVYTSCLMPCLPGHEHGE
jgi:hypothetical protein